MTAAEIVVCLEGVKQRGTGYMAKCPAHADGHASLSINTGTDGRVLLKCHAGCEVVDICSAMFLEMTDLFPEETKRPTRERITLAALADSKRLPQTALIGFGLRDLADGGVGIPYRNQDGSEALLKRRTAIAAKEGSVWPKGAALMPYGLERLADARELEYVVLVEGESDCWVLWRAGFPALGIPGASATGALQAPHVAGIGTIYAIEEPDKGGATFAAALPKRLATIGWAGRLIWVRLTGAKDPCELYGRDPAAFKTVFEAELETARTAAQGATGFANFGERLAGERTERLVRAPRIMPFGIKFLDECLGGVFPNDLVLVGAAPGQGKTALCTAIAHHNVRAGRRLHYFALEAEPREIERRIKYREIGDRIYRETGHEHLRHAGLNYIDWYAGKLDNLLAGIEADVDTALAAQFKTLHTYYKQGAFGVDDLDRALRAVQDDTEGVVIDHLHYVDIDGDDENRGVKGVVMRLRDLALMFAKPIFLVAHLRKGERKSTALVPSLDDFHGTSETQKVATKAIMIAQARNETSGSEHLWPTYMYAPKCRMDGARTRYAAIVYFNARTQAYEDKYVLGRLSWDLTKFEAIPNKDMPAWALSAVRGDEREPARGRYGGDE